MGASNSTDQKPSYFAASRDVVVGRVQQAAASVGTALQDAVVAQLTDIVSNAANTGITTGVRASMFAVLSRAGITGDKASAIVDSIVAKQGMGEQVLPAYISGSDEDTVEGGCGCKYIGSMETNTIADYENSRNSKSKAQLVDSIIEAIAKLGVKVESGDRKTQLKSVIAQLPIGDKIRASDANHKKTCMNIAASINKIYSSKVIDLTMPPAVVCQQTAEILSSLDGSMHAEFVAIYEDVRRVLSNLHQMKDFLTRAWEQMQQKLKDTADPAFISSVTQFGDTHKIIVSEMDRQIMMLENLIGVHLEPADKDLAVLINRKKDIHGFIEKINEASPGSKAFSEVLAQILKGASLTAEFAMVIERALKTVGMTVADYTAEKNLNKLQERVARGLVGTKMDDDTLHNYLEAAELLVRNFYRSQDIAEVLSRAHSVSGSDEMTDIEGSYGDGVYGGHGDGVYGGDDVYKTSALDKRVKDRLRMRNLIFNAFYRQLNEHFLQFVSSLHVISNKMGTEIGMSDQLDGFRAALSRINMNLIRSTNVYYALCGYYNDANSKSKRDEIIGEFKLVASFLEAIIESPQYRSSQQLFSATLGHIKSILAMIERYSTEIATKFGSEDSACPTGAYDGGVDLGMYGGADDMEGGTDLGIYGGAEAGIYGGADSVFSSSKPEALKFGVAKDISDALREFDYKYRVSQIRMNMARTGKELDAYSAKYEKMVASSISDILRNDLIVYQAARLRLQDAALAGTLAQIVPAAPVGAPAGTPADVVGVTPALEIAAALKFLDDQWEAKKKFWATLEAVDTYMQVFTDSLVKNPADIREIKVMLDDIDVISTWYTESSGNSLAAAFDQFPTEANANPDVFTDVAYAAKKVAENSGNNQHYYENIEPNYKPGNPFLVALPSQGQAAKNKLKQVFQTLAVLKNLFSVFINIGSKFGGEELRKKVFMSPTQMHANLVEYLQASAFAQGHDLGAYDATAKTWANEAANPAVHDINGVKLGLGAAANTAAAPTKFLRTFGVYMRPIDSAATRPAVPPAAAVNVGAIGNLSFNREDDLFVVMLKSIAAKIFTVTGMYDVMDRPFEFNGFSPIRMMIGGAEDTPKVEEPAVALYLRLPLLALFYRNLFNFDDLEDINKYSDAYKNLPRNDAASTKISMVPDVDGTFAGLIRLIFRQNKFIDSKAFSDDDIKAVIRECNVIYHTMKGKYPENTIMETIHELVAEVNRRYGLVSKSEKTTYEKEFGYRYNYTDQGNYDEMPENVGEIPILPGEEDDEVSRPSAAQRMLGDTFDLSTTSGKKSGYTIVPDHKKVVYDFRCMVDKLFENSNEEYTFDQAIKNTQRKLARETNDETRFKIVAQLVRGVDVTSKIDNMKYVMFHETVVTGLNTLSAMHTLLLRFQQRAQLLDLETMEKELWGVIKVAPAATTMANLVAALKANLVARPAFANTDRLTELLESIFGKTENAKYNGGANNTVYSLKPVDIHSDNNIDRCSNITGGANINSNGITNQLAHILNGLAATDFDKYRTKSKMSSADETIKAKIQMFMRFVFSRENVMKELMETLFAFGHDFQGLVDVRFDDDRIQLSFGGLKKLITDMFSHVQYFLDLMRPQIKQELFNRYTNKLIPGSFYWLQEQIMEKIVVGREPHVSDLSKQGYRSIDALGRALNTTYQKLTQGYSFNGSTLKPNVTLNSTPGHNTFDKVFAEMIFYDGVKPQSGLAISTEADGVTNGVATDSVKIADIMHNPLDQLLFTGAGDKKTLDTRFIARWKQLYTWKKEMTGNKSALFAFNQLIAKFIQTFYDSTGQKMYGNLVQSFAGGVFSRAVNDYLYTYPDTAPLVWMKKGGSSEVKMAPAVGGQVTLNAARAPLVSALAEVISFMVENGVPPTLVGGKRKGMFDGTSSLLQAATTQLNGQNVTRMVLEYLKFIVTKYITEKINAQAGSPAATALGGAGGVFNNNDVVAVLQGFDPTIVDLGTLRTAFNADNATNLTTESKVWTKLGTWMNTDATLAPSMDQIVKFDANFKIDRTIGLGTNYAAPQLYNIFDNIIIMKYKVDGNVIGSAIQDVPAATQAAADLLAAGTNMSDSKSRVLGYARVWTAVAQLVEDATAAGGRPAYDLEYTKLREVGSKTSVVYSPGGSSTQKTQVAYADLLSSDMTNIMEPINNVMYVDTGAFLVARDAAVTQWLNPHSIDNLGPVGSEPAGAKDLATVVKFGERQDPDADHVLFSSLAAIMRNLVGAKSATGTGSLYLSENIADVPAYMKEKMRANLPGFRNMFQELLTRCEFIRRVLSQRTINATRDYPNGMAMPTHNPWPFVLKPVTKRSDETKARFIGILETIIKGCQSFVAACEQCLKEVGDDAKYFETYQASIRDYKTQYGFEPFMPISSMLAVLKNTRASNVADFLPVHSLGEDAFKFAYGTRSLLHQMKSNVLPEHVAGWTQIVENFNSMSDSRFGADKNRCNEYMQTYVKMLRYIFESKHIKGALSQYQLTNTDAAKNVNVTANVALVDGVYSRDDLVLDTTQRDGATRPAGAIQINNKSDVSIIGYDASGEKQMTVTWGIGDKAKEAPVAPSAYAIATNMTAVVRMSEASAREDQIKLLVKHLLSEETVDQNTLEIRNIIDLNIIPINVHAMRRELPLANLYNYSYSFDRMIVELYYGLGNVNTKKIIQEFCNHSSGEMSNDMIHSAKDMLVAMLINPYIDVKPVTADALFDRHVRDMMLGVANTGDIARPKFLSDQLFNKVLFGQMSTGTYTEMGPGAAQVTRYIDGVGIHKILTDVFSAVYGQFVVAGPITQAAADSAIAWTPSYILKNQGSKHSDLYVAATKALTGVGADIVWLVTRIAKLIGETVMYVISMINKLTMTIANGASIIVNTIASAILFNDKATTLAAITAAPATDDDKRFFNRLVSQVFDSADAKPATILNAALGPITNAAITGYIGNRVARAPSTHQNNGVLSYMDDNNYTNNDFGAAIQPDNDNIVDPTQVKTVNITDATATAAIGVIRFDTILVRNLIFIVNLYRSVRAKLNRDLNYSRDLIARSASITRPQLTEFYGNQVLPKRSEYRPLGRNVRY